MHGIHLACLEVKFRQDCSRGNVQFVATLSDSFQPTDHNVIADNPYQALHDLACYWAKCNGVELKDWNPDGK